MTIYPASTGFVQVGAYRLNVTTRAASNDVEHLHDITFDTIRMWLFCTAKIKEGVEVVELAEGAPATVENKYKVPRANEPFCTVWGDVEPGQSLTVHSSVDVQLVLDTWNARATGVAKALQAFPTVQQAVPQNTSESRQEGAGMNLPPSTAPLPIEGIVNATRAPSARAMEYANGQMVRYAINRINAAVKGDTPVYELWTAHGSRYPSFVIYTDNERQMKAVGDFLNGLQLSFQKPAVEGDWSLIVQTSNAEKGGGPIQYYNPIRFE